MLDQYELIKRAKDAVEKLSDANGVVRCALIYELYKTLCAIEDCVKKNEKDLNEQKLILEEQVKDLTTALNGETPESVRINLDPLKVNVPEQIEKLKQVLSVNEEA